MDGRESVTVKELDVEKRVQSPSTPKPSQTSPRTKPTADMTQLKAPYTRIWRSSKAEHWPSVD